MIGLIRSNRKRSGRERGGGGGGVKVLELRYEFRKARSTMLYVGALPIRLLATTEHQTIFNDVWLTKFGRSTFR